ncbi:MAG: hypothetical protein ACTIKD_10155 [Sphingobacteriaceae bacterium]
MSSHHIIRDNQEPAVFLGELDGISDNLLGQILEWSPTVICLDKSMEALEAQGIKVNVLIRAVDQTSLDDVQADLEILTYQGDYLSVLFGYLEKAENFAIYLIGCFPNPTLLRYAERFSINLLNGNRHSLYIKRFSKWLPKGTLLHMDTEIQQPPDTLKRSGEDTYEVIREGFVEIPEQKHYFLLTEEML